MSPRSLLLPKKSKPLPTKTVFDPDFRCFKTVPSELIRHTPAPRLGHARLVFCRNYVANTPESCSAGDSCIFVHVDIDLESLESHPVHVNCSWRREDLCTYARLPAGEVLHVTATNNRPPVEEIPSERVLVTRGSLRYRNVEAVHHHCMHYHQHHMCNRGERCNFIHVVNVNAEASEDSTNLKSRCLSGAVRRHSSDEYSELGGTNSGSFMTRISPETIPHMVRGMVDAMPRTPPCDAVMDVSCHVDTPTAQYFHYNPYSPLSNYRRWFS